MNVLGAIMNTKNWALIGPDALFPTYWSTWAPMKKKNYLGSLYHSITLLSPVMKILKIFILHYQNDHQTPKTNMVFTLCQWCSGLGSLWNLWHSVTYHFSQRYLEFHIAQYHSLIIWDYTGIIHRWLLHHNNQWRYQSAWGSDQLLLARYK